MEERETWAARLAGCWSDLASFERDFDGHVLMRIHLVLVGDFIVAGWIVRCEACGLIFKIGVKFSSIQNNVI